ncbi:TraR/DksA family transcriptional regulator [Corallococcus sicarius]|nr:TraR/DksA family transcriptional regulator [Corallococcus sicarius]
MNAMHGEVRQQLLHRRKTLLALRDLHRLAAEAVEDSGAPEWVDRAVALEEKQMIARLDALERWALHEVDQALERLRPDDTVQCEACGATVEPERLHALPEARRCLCCAARTR